MANRVLYASISVFILIISLTAITSAYTDYYPSIGDYSWDSGSSSMSFSKGPSYSSFDRLSQNYASSNYDSGSSYSSSTGPYIKNKIKYNEYWRYDDGDWIKEITYTDNSFMVGGSSYSGSEYQNRQSTTWTIDEESNKVYQGAFSWSKAEDYDETEYDSGYWNDYYYHPVYSDGCYNWNY